MQCIESQWVIGFYIQYCTSIYLYTCKNIVERCFTIGFYIFHFFFRIFQFFRIYTAGIYTIYIPHNNLFIYMCIQKKSCTICVCISIKKQARTHVRIFKLLRRNFKSDQESQLVCGGVRCCWYLCELYMCVYAVGNFFFLFFSYANIAIYTHICRVGACTKFP